MLSVNQMNAQIKLTEMWKMANSGIYPPEKKMESEPGMRCSISTTNGKLIEDGKSTKSTSTFVIDSTSAWMTLKIVN